MMKTTDTEAAKARAEALFQQQGAEGVGGARHAVEAARIAEAEKIAKLRALRLAKEEIDRKAAEVRKARRQMRAP